MISYGTQTIDQGDIDAAAAAAVDVAEWEAVEAGLKYVSGD